MPIWFCLLQQGPQLATHSLGQWLVSEISGAGQLLVRTCTFRMRLNHYGNRDILFTQDNFWLEVGCVAYTTFIFGEFLVHAWR